MYRWVLLYKKGPNLLKGFVEFSPLKRTCVQNENYCNNVYFNKLCSTALGHKTVHVTMILHVLLDLSAIHIWFDYCNAETTLSTSMEKLSSVTTGSSALLTTISTHTTTAGKSLISNESSISIAFQYTSIKSNKRRVRYNNCNSNSYSFKSKYKIDNLCCVN